MQSWQSSLLGIRALPRDLSEFELQAFFTLGADERRLIETRRTDAHQLGLALHIGFIRLSGQLPDAKRIVPVRLWQHLGVEIGVPNPEIATLKAMYRRGRTLLEHQRMACDQLGVSRMREHNVAPWCEHCVTNYKARATAISCSYLLAPGCIDKSFFSRIAEHFAQSSPRRWLRLRVRRTNQF